METALTAALARIYRAIEKADLPAWVMEDFWNIRNMTPEGQWFAVYRWERCIQTWPTSAQVAA